ncbi:sensor histidine kinase [Pseudarthrobacter sp. J1763]|uniref:sensor histidine kinase n=1 Tax=Pseudarthrobacter sp. J1763 TaxID=3420445 RepID=UPI003D29B520
MKHQKAAAGPGTFLAPGSAAGAAVASTFAEISARRRGKIRRYFFEHPRVVDAAVVATYVLLALLSLASAATESHLISPFAMAGIAVALFFRRRWPVPVLAVVAALEVVSAIGNFWGSNVSSGLWFALYAVAVVYRRVTALIATLVASLPLVLSYFFFASLPDVVVEAGSWGRSDEGIRPENLGYVVVVVAVTIMLSNVIAAGVGMAVKQRREHEAEVAAWATRTAELGVLGERNRIAREMHDVVAHSLTVMISLSDGASVVMKKSPERAAEVLAELSRTGRTALADMRRVLGVLREAADGDTAPRGPLTVAGDLERMLEGFRTAGLPLHYSYTGPALPEDTAFRLTVYRIVQESLTNSLRYARGLRRVDLVIARVDNSVTIRVDDDGARSDNSSQGTGRGIAGMHERAGIYSGSVKAGPKTGGGWNVTAVLNYQGDSA